MTSPSPVPFLRQTNVSQPQLHHSSDTHSVSASEDYYSLASSSAHSNESQTAVHPPPIRRFQTPPSRYRTPTGSRERMDDKTAREEGQNQAPMRGTGRRRMYEGERESTLSSLMAISRPGAVSRKPVPTTVYEDGSPATIRRVVPNQAMSSAAREVQGDSDPPTPDVDDTPYIHFALDQLTRDEEVSGSRLYPGLEQSRPPTAQDRLDTYNAARTSSIPMSQDGAPDERPSIRPGPISPIEPLEPFEFTNTFTTNPSSPWSAEGAIPPPSGTRPVPPRNPARSQPGIQPQRPRTSEAFLPLEGPSRGPYLSLGYLPAAIRTPSLIALFTFQLLLVAALIFSAVWSLDRRSLWAYSTFGDGRYFLFQYLPTIIGVVLLQYFLVVQSALIRTAPFIALSSSSSRMRSSGALLSIYPPSLLYPTFEHFRAGLPAIGAFNLATWFSIFTLPLLATSFNVYQVDTGFVWIATQGVIWVVVAIYIVTAISTIWLLLFLRQNRSGLKWDPTSLADILVILEKSNLLDTYAAYFSAASDYDFREDAAARGDKLGNWRTSSRPNAAIHTLAAPYQPTRQYVVQEGRLVEWSRNRDSVQLGDPTRLSSQTTKGLLADSAGAGAAHVPLVLRPAAAFILATVFMGLFVAFAVVSYLPSSALQTGFPPRLPIPVNSAGFSPPNFLYSFLPSALGLAMAVLLQHIDTTLRRYQPIANLNSATGATPEASLLASYTSDPPVLVTLRALLNGDLRLAVVSLASFVCWTLPVLAGGVFWTQFSVPRQTTSIYIHRPAFHALTFFLAMVCCSFLALPFIQKQSQRYAAPVPEGATRRRRNELRRLVDVVALVHQSRLLSDAAFRAPATRTQMVTRILSGKGYDRISAMRDEAAGLEAAGGTLSEAKDSRVSLSDRLRGFGGARGEVAGVVEEEEEHANDDEEGRFRIGRGIGRDGRPWTGLDRAERMAKLDHHHPTASKGRVREKEVV